MFFSSFSRFRAKKPAFKPSKTPQNCKNHDKNDKN
jgi:hypothetical protein